MSELKIIDCINHAMQRIQKWGEITKEQRKFEICLDKVKIKKLSDPWIKFQTEAWGNSYWRDLLIMDDTGEIILRIKQSREITKEKIFSFAENDLLKIIDVCLVRQNTNRFIVEGKVKYQDVDVKGFFEAAKMLPERFKDPDTEITIFRDWVLTTGSTSNYFSKKKINRIANRYLPKNTDNVICNPWRLSTIPTRQSKIFVNDEIGEYEKEKEREGRIKVQKEIIDEEKIICPVCGKKKDGRSEKCKQCYLDDKEEKEKYDEGGLRKDIGGDVLPEFGYDDDDNPEDY